MRKKQYKNKKEDDFLDYLSEDIDSMDNNEDASNEDEFDLPLLNSFDKDSDDAFLKDDDVDDDDNGDDIEIPLKVKTKINKKKFYVDPQKFDEEIMKFYDTNVMSDELATMVNHIATKLSFASNFINYSYKNDMIGDAVIRMIKALITKKYNRDKGTNPFSYFTRIAFNSFRNRIKREKHIHETHERYREELELMAEHHNNNICKNKNGNNKFKNY